MESSSSPFFVIKNGSKKLSPLATAFIIIQLIFLIIVVATIIWINNSNNEPDSNVTRYKKIPELTIKDLAANAPILSEPEIESIQKKLFQVVSENASSINVSKIEAVIRNDVTHAQKYNKSSYLNMIVDIPSLEQSYEVIYSTNALIDPDITTFVLCLDEDTEAVYKDFDCKSSDDSSTREKVVQAYLKYFKFDYFTAYVKPDDAGVIVISPAITYENSEETKAKYIDEVKESIESLGMHSDAYEYYVRTAKDVNYRN